MRAKMHCCLFLAFLVPVGCHCSKGSNRAIPLIENKETAKIGSEVDRLLSVADPSLAPLKSMDAKQQKAVLVAIGLMRVLSVYQGSMIAKDEAIVRRWQGSLAKWIPGIGNVVDVRPSLGCFDANLAYASGMAKCLEDEKKSEDDCERENAGNSAAVIGCLMKELEGLRLQIPKLPDVRGPLDPRERREDR